jgi:hypothetical protein
VLSGASPPAKSQPWSSRVGRSPNEAKTLVELFSERFGLNPVQVVAAVRSCDYLLRQSAAMNLSAAELRRDLETLSGPHRAGVDLLLSRYDVVSERLRRRILEETLADHGNVLIGFDWRVEHVTASNRGTSLATAVTHLSLRYRDGAEVRRLSLQLTPETLRSLRQFCEELGG